MWGRKTGKSDNVLIWSGHNREPIEIFLGIKHITAFTFIKVPLEEKYKTSKLSEETHKKNTLCTKTKRTKVKYKKNKRKHIEFSKTKKKQIRPSDTYRLAELDN